MATDIENLMLPIGQHVLISPSNPNHYRKPVDGAPLRVAVEHVAPAHGDPTKDGPLYWCRITDAWEAVLAPFHEDELQAIGS